MGHTEVPVNNMKNKLNPTTEWSDLRMTMEDVWMQTAINLSSRSKCSKAQVGCVITTKDLRHVLSNGYNGYAAGVDYVCKKDTCSCLHAENNALINIGSEHKDKIVFVTMFPCLNCAIQIINSGCSKLYYHSVYKDSSKHWNDFSKIVKLLEEVNIQIIKL